MTTQREIKTCTRGHKYEGSGGCPICWKGNEKPDPTVGKATDKSEARTGDGSRHAP